MASKKTTEKKVEEVKTKKAPKKENTKKKTAPKAELKETKNVTKRKKTSPKKIEPQDLEKTTVFVTDEFIEKEKEQQKEAEKATKISHFRDIVKEIIAFLILVAIIALICFGGYYWYNHYYSKSNHEVKYEKVEKKIEDYNTVTYSIKNETAYLDVLNDKYLIEHSNKNIYKIMDLKTNQLYDGSEAFDYLYEGIDGNIYAYNNTGLEYESVIELYVLKDNKFEKIKTLSDNNIIYHALIYSDENNFQKLIGFYGLYTGYNEELQTTSETVVYTLDDKTINLPNYYFAGDQEQDRLSDIISYDSQYIIMYEIKDGKKIYGLYDVKEQKTVIKPQYEGLYTDGLNYIAIKKDTTTGKNISGIISSKLKQIVSFNYKYDFIARYKDYYVIGKNNKLAIMNDDYKLVTDFAFPYQPSNENLSYSYNLPEDGINTFIASKKNGKYILSINNGEEKGLKYDKHETYIINENGISETITTNKFYVSPNTSLIYSYNITDKKYTIYDQEFAEKYEIDLSEYDFTSYPEIDLINENTIMIHLNSDIYFNYETGEEISAPQDYQTLINGVTINYNSKNSNVEYQVNKETVAAIPVDISEDNVYFRTINDKILYYNTKKDYVYIEKGE